MYILTSTAFTCPICIWQGTLETFQLPCFWESCQTNGKPIEIKPKLTRGWIKHGKKKILRGQYKVTSSDRKYVNEIIKLSKEANKQQLEIIKKYNKNRDN